MVDWAERFQRRAKHWFVRERVWFKLKVLAAAIVKVHFQLFPLSPGQDRRLWEHKWMMGMLHFSHPDLWEDTRDEIVRLLDARWGKEWPARWAGLDKREVAEIFMGERQDIEDGVPDSR